MSINSNFSIYELTKQPSAGNIFMTKVSHLNHFSHKIEADVVRHMLNSPLYVGLQNLNNLSHIQAQYKRISRINDEIYVFGVDDHTPIQNMCGLNTVSVAPESKLAKEWFVLVNHPDYSKLLSAIEVEPDAGNSQRKFEATWSVDRGLITEIENRLKEELLCVNA